MLIFYHIPVCVNLENWRRRRSNMGCAKAAQAARKGGVARI